MHVRERGPGGKRRSILDARAARAAFAAALEAVAEAPIGERTAAIAGWTPERLLEERARFDAAYRPISILPDQYLSVVLQAAWP